AAMRTGWDARRRNRNLGTTRAGHGQDNRLVIPTSQGWDGHFAERLTSCQTVTRAVFGRRFSVLVENTRPGCVHPCTPDDIFRMLESIPAADRQGLDFLILRQPRRKEEILSPCWGRLLYAGPKIILEAIDCSRSLLRWGKSLRP